MKLIKYSPSKLNCYSDCARHYKYKYIEKLKVPFIPKAFFEKGKYIHYICEHYPNKPPKPFNFRLASPTMIEEWKAITKEILSLSSVQKLLSRDHSTEAHIRFKDDELSFQGYIDYLTIAGNKAMVIDWKTGQIYKNKTDHQIKLYAFWVLHNYPAIDVVKSGYYYVEHDVKDLYTFHRKDFDSIREYFINTITNIENDTDHEQSPSHNCRYCDYEHICKPHRLRM